MSRYKLKPKVCQTEGCGKEFQPLHPSHAYCTDSCRKKGYADVHRVRNREWKRARYKREREELEAEYETVYRPA